MSETLSCLLTVGELAKLFPQAKLIENDTIAQRHRLVLPHFQHFVPHAEASLAALLFVFSLSTFLS